METYRNDDQCPRVLNEGQGKVEEKSWSETRGRAKEARGVREECLEAQAIELLMVWLGLELLGGNEGEGVARLEAHNGAQRV